ncbi:MAG: cupin domain-containing protein [Chloroflexi bacterium]|nr:cupin domain-containing protein [Chloroflexota bacterium]
MMEDKIVGELSGRVTSYDRYVQSEGIPTHGAYYVEDLCNLNLGPWGRKGGNGCFINLIGSEQSTDCYVCEIGPGRSLKPEKHLYEEFIFILKGRGATSIWNEGGPKQTFEWQERSLFAIPLNAWHVHYNGQGDRPVKFVAATNAPIVLNLYHTVDFIFNNSYVFKDRYDGEQDYFNGAGKLYSLAGKSTRSWETNFVPDVGVFSLFEVKERGGGGRSIAFEMADSTMAAHISEFAVGCYKKAHRHGPGANVIIVDGEGYSVMWPEAGQRVVVPWRGGSLFVPPGRWFHQHFNTGARPARYVALKFTGSRKFPIGIKYLSSESARKGPDQIEYEDEDPGIRVLYESEMKKKGMAVNMPPY